MTGEILPTGLWLEAKLRELDTKAVSYYILQRGNHGSGLVILKLNGLQGLCRLITQQRNFMTGNLEWTNALDRDTADESAVDDYLTRARSRDPDLWIVEIEDRDMKNPFED